MPRKNMIFGKWIQRSRWWPDYQVRLFKRDSVTWPKEIHKQPQVKGNGYTIEAEEQCAILHYNYESVDEFMQKMSRYAKSEAGELSSFSLSEALKKGLSEFISRYFADEGYKDGLHGFVLAFLQMFYYFLVYVYYWERKKYEESSLESLQSNISEFFKNGLHETNHWLIQKKLVRGFAALKARIHNNLSKLI
jgi:(heptosyl)LPS beta-1,4-glucosyltransferase